MKFALIDRIDELVLSERIVASKSLSLAEEYLADHFPQFPVMPGVLMLEALTQASAWLVRVSEDFAHSVILLKGAKGIKYGKFVQPGQTLRLTASIVSQDESFTQIKAEGMLDGQTSLKAQLTLQRFNIIDTNPHAIDADARLVARLRNHLKIIWDGETL